MRVHRRIIRTQEWLNQASVVRGPHQAWMAEITVGVFPEVAHYGLQLWWQRLRRVTCRPDAVVTASLPAATHAGASLLAMCNDTLGPGIVRASPLPSATVIAAILARVWYQTALPNVVRTCLCTTAAVVGAFTDRRRYVTRAPGTVGARSRARAAVVAARTRLLGNDARLPITCAATFDTAATHVLAFASSP